MKGLIVAAMMVVGISAFGADQVDSWAYSEAKAMIENRGVERNSREQNLTIIEKAFTELSEIE